MMFNIAILDQNTIILFAYTHNSTSVHDRLIGLESEFLFNLRNHNSKDLHICGVVEAW